MSKVTWTLTHTDNGVFVTCKKPLGHEFPVYSAPGLRGLDTEAEAIRALAFRLLEIAGGYEFNPCFGTVSHQVRKMRNESGKYCTPRRDKSA